MAARRPEVASRPGKTSIFVGDKRASSVINVTARPRLSERTHGYTDVLFCCYFGAAISRKNTHTDTCFSPPALFAQHNSPKKGN